MAVSVPIVLKCDHYDIIESGECQATVNVQAPVQEMTTKLNKVKLDLTALDLPEGWKVRLKDTSGYGARTSEIKCSCPEHDPDKDEF